MRLILDTDFDCCTGYLLSVGSSMDRGNLLIRRSALVPKSHDLLCIWNWHQTQNSPLNSKYSMERCVENTHFWLSSVAYSYIHPSFVLQFLHITSRTMWRPVNMTRSWMCVYVKLTTRLNSKARPKTWIQRKKTSVSLLQYIEVMQ